MLQYASLYIYPCARILEAKLQETKSLCHTLCAFKNLTDTAKLSPFPNHVPIYTPTSSVRVCLFLHNLPSNLSPSGDLRRGNLSDSGRGKMRICVRWIHLTPCWIPGLIPLIWLAKGGSPSLSAPWGAQLRNGPPLLRDNMLWWLIICSVCILAGYRY